MLKFVTLPMHLGDGGMVTLPAILGRIPLNNLVWRMLFFAGIGKAPDGLTMPGFEDAVRASRDGYPFTWERLRMFASGIDEVWDCLIIGCRGTAPIQRDTIKEHGFPDCDYVIDALDSSEWKIGATDPAILATIKSLYQRTE